MRSKKYIDMHIKNMMYKVFTFEDRYLLILFFLIISTFCIFLLFIILYPPLKGKKVEGRGGGGGGRVHYNMHISMHAHFVSQYFLLPNLSFYKLRILMWTNKTEPTNSDEDSFLHACVTISLSLVVKDASCRIHDSC